MRDVDDGHPGGGEALDDAEEVVDLVGVEGGGGLVHHDEPDVVRERPRHGDDLLLCGGEVADVPGGVDLRVPEAGQQRLRGGAPLPRADDEAGAGRFVAEEDVLGDREVLDEVEFLVDGGDAQAHGGDRRLEPDLFAAPGDLAVVGLVGSGEHLDQGGLAGAVLAEEAVDLAGLDLQVDAVQGADAREELGDAGHGEQGWFRCHDESPRRMGSPLLGRCRAGRGGPVSGQGAGLGVPWSRRHPGRLLTSTRRTGGGVTGT